MAESFVVRREIQVAAPAATIVAFLTDPEKIIRWMGSDATMEPHPGGLYLLKVNERGSFREVVPVHRLAYSFGWDGDADVSPGSGLVEVDLIDQGGGTLVRFTHSGLPNAAEQADHGKGWTHYLGRLAVAAAGADPGCRPQSSAA